MVKVCKAAAGKPELAIEVGAHRFVADASVELIGALDHQQRVYLLGVDDTCPIQEAFSGRFEISTERSN